MSCFPRLLIVIEHSLTTLTVTSPTTNSNAKTSSAKASFLPRALSLPPLPPPMPVPVPELHPDSPNSSSMSALASMPACRKPISCDRHVSMTETVCTRTRRRGTLRRRWRSMGRVMVVHRRSSRPLGLAKYACGTVRLTGSFTGVLVMRRVRMVGSLSLTLGCRWI